MPAVNTTNLTHFAIGKPLESRFFDAELGVSTVTYTQSVGHGQGLSNTTGWTSERVEATNTGKSLLTYSLLDEILLPGGYYAAKEVASDCGNQSLANFACCVTRESRVVLTSAAPVTRSFGEITRSYKRVSATTGVYTVLKAKDGYIPLEGSEVDEDGTRYGVVRTVIDNLAAVPSDTATTIYSVERVDCEHRVLTSRAVASTVVRIYEEEDTQDTCLKIQVVVTDTGSGVVTPTPGYETQLTPKGPNRYKKVRRGLVNWAGWSRETKRTVEYSYPSRLTSLALSATFAPQQRRTSFYVFPLIKTGYSGPVEARVVETLHSSVPATLETLFAPQPEVLQYDGVLFQLNLPAVLHNGLNLSASTDARDTFWGFTVESFVKSATNVSATSYTSLIGTEVCISDVVVPYNRFCLYKRTRIYIPVK